MLSNLPAAVLLAAPEAVRAAWIENLAPLVLLVFWIARQVFAAIGEQKEAERLKEQQAENGVRELEDEPALAGAKPAAGGPQGDLRSEVEEFLKRVGQVPEGERVTAAEARAAELDGRSSEKDNQGMSPRIEEIGRRGPIDPFEEPVRRRPPRRQPEPEIELILENEAPATTPLQPASARQRVELRHLPESQLAEQAAHLGGQVALSDDRLEARLHEKFDHRLGKLDQRSEAQPEPTAGEESLTGAARIKALLVRPGGVREAVVLSEILRRPTDF